LGLMLNLLVAGVLCEWDSLFQMVVLYVRLGLIL